MASQRPSKLSGAKFVNNSSFTGKILKGNKFVRPSRSAAPSPVRSRAKIKPALTPLTRLKRFQEIRDRNLKNFPRQKMEAIMQYDNNDTPKEISALKEKATEKLTNGDQNERETKLHTNGDLEEGETKIVDHNGSDLGEAKVNKSKVNQSRVSPSLSPSTIIGKVNCHKDVNGTGFIETEENGFKDKTREIVVKAEDDFEVDVVGDESEEDNLKQNQNNDIPTKDNDDIVENEDVMEDEAEIEMIKKSEEKCVTLESTKNISFTSPPLISTGSLNRTWSSDRITGRRPLRGFPTPHVSASKKRAVTPDDEGESPQAKRLSQVTPSILSPGWKYFTSSMTRLWTARKTDNHDRDIPPDDSMSVNVDENTICGRQLDDSRFNEELQENKSSWSCDIM